MVACGNGNTRAREDAATAEVKGGWWWCRRLCGGRFSLCVPFCCFIFVTFCLFVCLLACFCVRAWEWVSRRGTSHNSLWFSRRTRAVGGEKQPFTLSLSFSLSASHSFSLLLTFVTCFSCCCSYLCRCRLLFYAHVAKKHTRRVAGSRQSETRVAFRCRQDRNLCLCMWNVCWVRLRLLSRSLTHSHTYTNWSICSLWFTTAFVCSILRLLIVSLFRSCSLSLHETERRVCGELVIAVGFCFSYSIWLSLHFSFNCYCLNAWKTN